MKGQMDVREVVKKAKEAIATIFVDEAVMDPHLEEITFDRPKGQPTWEVTISFRRSSFIARTFKAVHIDDDTGDVKSVMHREF